MGISRKIKNYFRTKKRIKKLEKKFPILPVKAITNILKKELVFNNSVCPKVSIIIPFYNQIDYTINCLHYLHKHLKNNLEVEIILINDNSTEAFDLSFITGIKVIRNKQNEGFLKSINIGIRESKGEYIYILNNDTEVKEDFLEALLQVFNNFSNVGAVGSKLLNADERLQEAGCVFLKNCSIHQIFNFRKKYFPQVNFINKVDYCSGCSLLFKRESDDGNLNLFDEQFAPAYFEETDFCFQLKYKQGKDIYYTPFSEVLHYNGVSYNAPQNISSDKIKQKEQLFAINMQKFKNKWHQQINAIQAETIEERIEELHGFKSIVIFCGIIPPHDKDSGSNRLKEIIQLYLQMGYYIILAKTKTFLFSEENEYILYYESLGVNVYYEHKNDITLGDYLAMHISKKTIAWFYNPDVFEEYYPIAKQHLPGATMVFDMVDIHHLRFKRALELEPGNNFNKKQFEKYKKIEAEAANLADYVITISDFEEKYMAQFCDPKKIITISNVHYIKTKLESTLSFEERNDILFIGSSHVPNIDALYFLYKEIMPIVWEKLPNLKVNIIGNVKGCINDINHTNFIFKGFVSNIEPLFSSNKLMVAPLRYGAGVKGKIGQAFEYFLPVVTTSIGAEGMQLTNFENALINDDKEGFANSIINLYSNKELWLKLQSNSEKNLQPFSKEKLKEQILKIQIK